MYNFIRKDGYRISESLVTQIEEAYGFRFPEPLRSYYLNCNGAKINDTDILIGESAYCVVDFFYPEAEEMRLTSIIDDARKYASLPEDMIPFAVDWGDNLFCWSVQSGCVYLSYSDDDDSTYVCDNMKDFFSLLNGERIDTEMTDKKYLPLGSIVLLKGGIQKLLIIGRALNVRKEDKNFFFDYGGVTYPEGLIGDQMAYFNADSINRVVFVGYSDDDDKNMVDNINSFLEANPDIVKGDPHNW